MVIPNHSDWRVLRASVRGATHRRTGLPNQDAIRIAKKTCTTGQAWILALADGHGSARSFRSHHGARLAVAVIQPICAYLLKLDNRSQIKRWAEEQLPLVLIRHWRARVERACRRRPFTLRELDALAAAGHPRVHVDPYLAYGSTLLAVIIAPHFILALQLGDGDIVQVSSTGAIERLIARDQRLIGNATTSLCTPDAWRDVRIRFQTLSGEPPTLIFAATDGYANAYRDDTDFLQVASDLHTMLAHDGEAAVKPHLKTWLNEASQCGSGDDISLGLAWRSGNND
jgi:hypothetical protein